MNQAIHALFEFNENTEVGEITDDSRMFGAHRILGENVNPRIRFELFDTEGHLTLFAVEGKDNGFDFVTFLIKILGGAQVLGPRHFGNVDKTFHARDDFHESAVVVNNNDFALHLVANLQIRVELVPRMRGELLETQSDAFLAFVESQDDDIDFLVELNHLFRVGDTTPRQVGDMDKSIHAAQVDKCAVRNDVLDGTFDDLTLFELADDLVLLSFELGFNESLVGDNDILVLVVDLDDLEFHGLVNIHVVVANGFDIDLGTRQESLDAEDVDDETAFGLALDITGDNLLVVVGFVDTLPRLEDEGTLVGELELAVGIFLAFHVDFDFVADLEIGVVTKFGSVDDAVGLETDVDNHLAGVDGDNFTHDNGVLVDRLEGLGVKILQAGFLIGRISGFLRVDLIPIEVLKRAVGVFKFSHLAGSRSLGLFCGSLGNVFNSFCCNFNGLICGFDHVLNLIFNLCGLLFGVVDDFF